MKKTLALLLIIAILGLMACAQAEPDPTITPTDIPLDSLEEVVRDAAAEGAFEALIATECTTGTCPEATPTPEPTPTLEPTVTPTVTPTTPAPTNQAPVVRAWGCDKGWALARLGEDAVVTDPEGDPLVYQWTVIDSPGTQTQFEDPTLLDPFVCLEGVGVWRFELSVTDGTTIVSDEVTITVEP